MIQAMRTTVDIDDDVLQAAKELADLRGLTAGKVLSDLARKGMATTHKAKIRNGVPVLPRRATGRKLTMRRVNELRDDE